MTSVVRRRQTPFVRSLAVTGRTTVSFERPLPLRLRRPENIIIGAGVFRDLVVPKVGQVVLPATLGGSPAIGKRQVQISRRPWERPGEAAALSPTFF